MSRGSTSVPFARLRRRPGSLNSYDVAAVNVRSFQKYSSVIMTIRNRLNHRIYPVSMISLACAFAFGGSLTATTLEPRWGIVALLSLLGLMACRLFVRFGVRCPRCTKAIGSLVYLPDGGYSRLSKYLRFCPFCGTNLEAETETEPPHSRPAEATR